MSSCAVCYEPFGSGDSSYTPRRLPCSHVVCTQCLEDCFEDAGARRGPDEKAGAGVRCPECFVLALCNSVVELPIHEPSLPVPPLPTRGHGRVITGDYSLLAAMDSGSKAQHERRAGSQDGSGTSANKLQAFLAASQVDMPPSPIHEIKTTEIYAHCKYPGCTVQEDLSMGYCSHHTKRASVGSVKAMIHQFQRSSLTDVKFSSEKVELLEGRGTSSQINPDEISKKFCQQDRMEVGDALALLEQATEIMSKERNIVHIEAPVMVVGDVHGQYFDLLNILDQWQQADSNILFLGDYVDRGAFSCEVILHLLALKVQYPKQVFLLRGNHECSTVCSHFGFKEECKSKYGLPVFYRFLSCFQAMPIAAVIETKLGNIFACHGGISPSAKTLADIENINRFSEPDMAGPLCDILWADPVNDDETYKLNDDEYREFLEMDFVNNQVRGCSFMFGYRAIAKFLRDNRLIYMLRAHEVQEEGFRLHFSESVDDAAPSEQASDSDFCDDSEAEDRYTETLDNPMLHMNPTVLTVFSAPNYCDRYGNKAAVLHIEQKGCYTVSRLEAKKHPEPKNPMDMNVVQLLAMGRTCPYLPTNFREFLRVASEMGSALQPIGHEDSAGGDVSAADGAAHDGTPMTPTPTRASHKPHSLSQSADFWAEVKSSIESRLKQGQDHDLRAMPQGGWGDVMSPSRGASQYRMAHARDGINEMHPSAINNRLAECDEASQSKSKHKARQFSLDLSVHVDAVLTESQRERDATTASDFARILSSCTLSELVLREGLASPAPSNRNPSRRDGPSTSESERRTPSQVLFSHEEIIVLKLLFSLFDRKGKGFISRDDIVAYAEECGDYAQLKEVDAVMDAVDADCDGQIGLADYISFAHRLKSVAELKESLKSL